MTESVACLNRPLQLRRLRPCVKDAIRCVQSAKEVVEERGRVRGNKRSCLTSPLASETLMSLRTRTALADSPRLSVSLRL